MSVRGPFDPSTGEFLPIDSAAFAKRWDLTAKGRDRGKLNLPPKAAKVYDDVELLIENEVVTVARQAQGQVGDHLRIFQQRLSVLSTEGIIDRIRVESQKAWAAMFGDARASTNLLFDKKKYVLESETWLGEYRKANNLTRPATFPEGHGRAVSVIALLFIVESIANAALFASANEFGIVGGVVEMFFISLANMFFGFVAGRALLPQLNHADAGRKAFGFVALLALVAALVLFNLLAGHYRDALASFSASPSELGLPALGTEAVNRFLSAHWYRLEDFRSWLMAILGAIFACIAMIEGYRWDDRYPGYGMETRNYQRKLHEYGEAFESAQYRLAELLAEGHRNVDALVEQAKGYRAEVDVIKDQALRARRSFFAYAGSLEATAQNLLQTYRYASLEKRTEPGPKYWDKAFALDRQIKDVPDITAPPKVDLEAIEVAATVARKRADAGQLDFLKVYRTIDQITAATLETFKADSFIALIDDIKGKFG